MTTDNFLTSFEYLKQRALGVPAMPVHPAVEETAVIVPVLGRPQNAATFMESLKSSNSPTARVYAVGDFSDKPLRNAWKEAGATGVIAFNDSGRHPGTFAEKVNIGYKLTEEPWIFIVGDDVRFHFGWLDQAQDTARDGFHVIGTNDLHNELVILGMTSAHLLIRRNYVQERGASWDGPGVVCHEGYRHNCPDSEIVDLANERNVWAFARHSKVEHFHPFWGGAPVDDTYKIGQVSHDKDLQLYIARKEQYARAGV